MKIILRKYQQEATKAAFARLKAGDSATIIHAPTGSGKSLIIADICLKLKKMGKSAVILHHSAELCMQNTEALRRLDDKNTCSTSIVSSKLRKFDLSGDFIFSTIRSMVTYLLTNRIAPDFLIVDECHKVNYKEGEFNAVCNHHLKKGGKIIGLSATPWRRTSGSLHGEDRIFDSLCYSIGVKFLTEKGYLSPIVYQERPVDIDFSAIKMSPLGDYMAHSIEEAYWPEMERIANDLVECAKNRRSWLIFMPTLSASFHLSDILKKKGIIAVSISGKDKFWVREKALKDLEDGKIRAILNVETMTTGINCPAIDCIIALRPTTSSGLCVQMIGRGTRTSPETNKKNCLVIDYANWLFMHGRYDEILSPEKDAEQKRRKANQRAIEEIEIDSLALHDQIPRALLQKRIISGDRRQDKDGFFQGDFTGKVEKFSVQNITLGGRENALITMTLDVKKSIYLVLLLNSENKKISEIAKNTLELFTSLARMSISNPDNEKNRGNQRVYPLLNKTKRGQESFVGWLDEAGYQLLKKKME